MSRLREGKNIRIRIAKKDIEALLVGEYVGFYHDIEGKVLKNPIVIVMTTETPEIPSGRSPTYDEKGMPKK